MNTGKSLSLLVILICVLLFSSSASASRSGEHSATTRQGKILGTGAVSSLSGASGGGLFPWATIGTYASSGQKGLNLFKTSVWLDDYRLTVDGAAIAIGDRFELAYANQSFRIKNTGAEIQQDKFTASYKILGDLLYGSAPQITLSFEHGALADNQIASSVGARDDTGTDFLLSAGKVWLDGLAHRTTLLNVNIRYGKQNQFGLLGHGGDAESGKLTTEIATAVFLNRNIAVGLEFRQKKDNLNAIREEHARDLFVAWFINKHVSVTGAWVDLGAIAGARDQRGVYLSLQATL
ncbi:DUF3034 family protein [Pseudohongiella spirulinae]|uniref:Uncharacterized conserved secreted protein n=1 Tax=Pseudohongiella spirulinae TaxID=1249552 RepID=A0A0S2KCL2_9GAMM|nr:DUF3034 family protein [Pseudohongiella spirulinae]ALO46072.1 Uncharacterized conserved secreted protein [Pseudohongiella spirulinae]